MIGGKLVLEDVEVEWTLDQGSPDLVPVEPRVRFTVTKVLPGADLDGIETLRRDAGVVDAADFHKAVLMASSSDPDKIFGKELAFTTQLCWDAVERVKKATKLCWLP